MEIYGSVSFQSSVTTYGSVTFQSSIKLVMVIYGSVSEAGEFGLYKFNFPDYWEFLKITGFLLVLIVYPSIANLR